MKALVYHGPGQKAWETVPDPVIQEPTDVIVRIDSSTICGTDLHILKGDVPDGEAGDDPRPRGGRHDHRARLGGDDARRRRPRARLLHQRLRPLQLLPRGPLRPVHGRRRLDLRPPDRRPPGRVRPRPVRGHLRLQDPGRADGRAGALPGGHPPDRVRGRRPERQGGAGRHDRGRRRGADRPRHDHDRTPAHARRRSSRSTSPTRGSPARSTSARTW